MKNTSKKQESMNFLQKGFSTKNSDRNKNKTNKTDTYR